MGRKQIYTYIDSVGKPSIDTNLYAYTGNNPVNRIDPLGLTWLEYIRSSGTLIIHPGDFYTQAPPSAVFNAFNNAQRKSRGDWEPGFYSFAGWVEHSRGTPGDIERFGVNGNFVFTAQGWNCVGCGIHGGHANKCDQLGHCGAAHATNGCVRTTDEAVFELRRIYHHNQDPILFLYVH